MKSSRNGHVGRKVTFFGADFPPTMGGISTLAYDWVLNTAGHPGVGQVDVVMFANKQPRTEMIAENANLHAYSVKDFISTGFLVLVHMLRNFRSAAFHSFNLFPIGFWTVFWSRLLFRRSIVHFYGTDACSTAGNSLTRDIKKWTLEHATVALTISNFTKNETMRRLRLKRKQDPLVIYPPVPIHSLEKARHAQGRLDPRIRDNDFVVLSVCRMVVRKGLDTLIRAVAGLSDKRIRLVLVGDGPDRKRLEHIAQDVGAADRVIFVGRVDDTEPYYKRADIAVLLSRYVREEGDFEGLGLVLLEAEHFGVPVIGSKSGGIPETFEVNRTGLLVPEGNIDGLRAAILRLYSEPGLRQTMGNEARKLMTEDFDPEKNINKYYENCLHSTFR